MSKSLILVLYPNYPITMKDALGDRMKQFYEDITRYFLPRKSYVLIRIDGKAFHKYTSDVIIQSLVQVKCCGLKRGAVHLLSA